MQRLIGVWGVMAIAVLTAGAAHAQFQYGMNYFQFENWDNGGGDGSGAAFQPGGWTATTSGAIWISTGGTTPVLSAGPELRIGLPGHSNLCVDDNNNTCLFSNGVAVGDATDGLYPGYWWVDNVDHGSPCAMEGGQYYLPGTLNPDYPDGQPTQEGMQFNLYAWTGNYNSYAAAAGAGSPAGMSGAFQVGPTEYWISPVTEAFINMPSFVLTIPGDANYDGKVDINDLTVVLAHYNQSGMTWSQGEFTGSGTVDINDLTIVLAHYNQGVGSSAAGVAAVPEPSTIAIAAAALLGLLACCRRKRT